MQKSSSKGRLSSQVSKSSRGRKEVQDEPFDEDEEPVYTSLAWQVLTEGLLVEMSKLCIEDVAVKLAEILSYTNHKECLREAALLDVYVAMYWFGKEQEFSNQQLSAFFTLVHKLISNCKSGLSMLDNIQEFQKLLVGAGMTEKCPLGHFSKEQVKWLADYIMSSLFQHYCLYQYLFTEEQDDEIISMKLPMCIPPPYSSMVLPPLEEAVPEQFYLKYINPPLPSEDSAAPVTPDTHCTSSELATELATETVVVNTDVLDGVTAIEVKSVVDKIAAGAIASFETEILQKIQDKEKSITKQLNQIEKATVK